jgi:hypothetical protein
MKAKQREVLPMFDSGMPHRPVIRTSVLAWEAHGGFTGRKKATFALLRHVHEAPTSGELAHYRRLSGLLPEHEDPTATLLMIRRGLSDLLACGAVEHGPSRPCKVTGETCVTWRIVTR